MLYSAQHLLTGNNNLNEDCSDIEILVMVQLPPVKKGRGHGCNIYK